MKISGFTIIKNAIINDYPIVEAITSILPVIDEMIVLVGDSNDETKNIVLLRKVVKNIRELHTLLKVDKSFSRPDDELLSYDIAHHAGLSLEDEYELHGLLREDQRLEYLKRHLTRLLPVVDELETLKHRIKLNGHFKNLSSSFNL